MRSVSNSGFQETVCMTDDWRSSGSVGLPICPRCDYDWPQVPEYISSTPLELLRTNREPSNAEATSVRGILDELEQVLSRLDKEVAEFEVLSQNIHSVLKSLKERKFQVEKDIKCTKGILSPIRRLPDEILSEIILYALGCPRRISIPQSRLYDYRRQDEYVYHQLLWTFTQVSQRWREVTISQSLLWYNISVEYPHKSQPPTLEHVEMLTTILSRARLRPLHLDLVFASSNPVVEKLLKVTTASSRLWRNISLDMPADLFTKLSSIKNSIDLLETFHIKHGAGISAEKICTYFANAPSLRRVTCSGIAHVPSLNLPWSQLTHFELNDGTCLPLSFLRKLPNLRSLNLNDTYSSTDTTEQIVLLHLRSLTIGCTDSDLLHHLRLPSLREVEVGYFAIDSFVELVCRSSSSLEILRWDGRAFEKPAQLTSLFKATPSLNTLDLQYISADEVPSFMEVLSAHDEHFVLPNLRILIFGNECVSLNFELIQVISDTIRSRWKWSDTHTSASTRFHTLRFVDITTGWFHDWETVFSSLRADGLEITIERLTNGDDNSTTC